MLEEILQSLVIEMAGQKTKRQKNAIGVVSNELCQEFKDLIEAKEEMLAELKFKHERAMKKIEKKLFEEFRPKMASMDKEKDELWVRIRKELCILGHPDLNINTSTGVISEWEEKPK